MGKIVGWGVVAAGVLLAAYVFRFEVLTVRSGYLRIDRLTGLVTHCVWNAHAPSTGSYYETVCSVVQERTREEVAAAEAKAAAEWRAKSQQDAESRAKSPQGRKEDEERKALLRELDQMISNGQ